MFKKQAQNPNQEQINNLNINYNDIFGQQQNNNNQGGVDLNSLLIQNQNYNIDNNINQNLIPQSPQQNIGFQNYQNNFNIPQQIQVQNQIGESVNMPQYKHYSPLNSPKKVMHQEQLSPNDPLFISQNLTNNINIL